MTKRSKRNGMRTKKRQNQRDKKKWIAQSKGNRIEYEFERLDKVKAKFPDGELRVADCPVTGKPVLQAFTYPGKVHGTEKFWMCLHENGNTHKVDPDDEWMIERYLRKEEWLKHEL